MKLPFGDGFALDLLGFILSLIDEHASILHDDDVLEVEDGRPDAREALDRRGRVVLPREQRVLCLRVKDLNDVRLATNQRYVICLIRDRPLQVIDSLVLDLFTTFARNLELNMRSLSHNSHLFHPVHLLFDLIIDAILSLLPGFA